MLGFLRHYLFDCSKCYFVSIIYINIPKSFFIFFLKDYYMYLFVFQYFHNQQFINMEFDNICQFRDYKLEQISTLEMRKYTHII